ncbi:MAG: hypothetical protein ACLP5V_05215 [Candidatus Bathyarchaeia archaeon]
MSLSRISAAVSVGIMSGLALMAATISKFALHSQFVILNEYTNGSADWAIDATGFMKSILTVMLLVFAGGLALGLLLTKRD